MTARFPLATSLAVALLMAGCGGGGGGQSEPADPVAGQQGSIEFSVTWPEPSRLIPKACNSIVVDIADPQGVLMATQTIPRPLQGVNTSSITFTDLMPGNLVATATAYPVADGSGVPQATGKVPIVIKVGETAQATLTMGSTVKSVEVTPVTMTIKKGESANVVASAKDDQGRSILLAAGGWKWASADVTIASVDANTGLVSGVGFGITTITATEQESGKKGTASVTVTGGTVVTVAVSPPDVTLTTGAKQQYTAVVSGLSDQRVTWSLPQGGGTLDANGLLTTGDTSGSYTVKATSVADPTKSGTAQFQVAQNTIVVRVNPLHGTPFLPGGQGTFEATVTGTTNQSVTWSATGGSITSNGVYTAGSVPGLYSVTATSVVDSSAKGSVAVTILPSKWMLTVKSVNPANIIHVDAAPPDQANKTGGDTQFDLEYSDGTSVTLTAQASIGGNSFDHWLLSDGTTGPAGVRAITFSIRSDMTATAIYTKFWELDVGSRDSSGNLTLGVPIQLSKKDRDGNQDGSTSFTRYFSSGNSVELMCPGDWPQGSGNKFLWWLVDGQKSSTYLNQLISMSSDHIVEAVYAKVWTATVKGQLASGSAFSVPITIAIKDLDSLNGGTTTFTRRYAEGNSITFEAPTTHGGKTFDRWRMNQYETTNNKFVIDGSGAITITAVYK